MHGALLSTFIQSVKLAPSGTPQLLQPLHPLIIPGPRRPRSDNQRAKDKPLVRITVAPTPTPQQQQQQQAGAPPAAPTHYVFAFETVPDRDAALDVLTKVRGEGL